MATFLITSAPESEIGDIDEILLFAAAVGDFADIDFLVFGVFDQGHRLFKFPGNFHEADEIRSGAGGDDAQGGVLVDGFAGEIAEKTVADFIQGAVTADADDQIETILDQFPGNFRCLTRFFGEHVLEFRKLRLDRQWIVSHLFSVWPRAEKGLTMT